MVRAAVRGVLPTAFKERLADSLGPTLFQNLKVSRRDDEGTATSIGAEGC